MNGQHHAIKAIDLLNQIKLSNDQLIDDMMNLIIKVNTSQKNSYDSLQAFRNNFDKLIHNLENINIEDHLEPEDRANLSIIR